MKLGENVHRVEIFKNLQFHPCKSPGSKFISQKHKNDFSTNFKVVFTPFPCSDQINSGAIRRRVQNMTGVEISVHFEALSQAQRITFCYIKSAYYLKPQALRVSRPGI